MQYVNNSVAIMNNCKSVLSRYDDFVTDVQSYSYDLDATICGGVLTEYPDGRCVVSVVADCSSDHWGCKDFLVEVTADNLLDAESLAFMLEEAFNVDDFVHVSGKDLGEPYELPYGYPDDYWMPF